MLDTSSSDDFVTQEENHADRGLNEHADETFADQDWDMHSPLIPNHPPDIHNDNDEQVIGSSLQVDMVNCIVQDDGVDLYNLFLEICSVVTMVLFFGLTAGSFFYPWFDTKLKLLLDKSNSLPFDVDVPLFEDTTFAHVFAMFRSLHSMYAIRTIGILSFLLPSLCFACQIFCHGVLHSIRCNSEANCNGSIARITRNKNGWQILKSELCAYWHSIVMPRKVLKLVSVPLYLVKFSMTVAYVILIHEVVLSHVHFAVGGDFSPDDATMMAIKTSSNISYLYARVVNETRGGFVAYMIGVILGSYSLMAIKVRFLNKCQDVCIQQDEDESSNESTNLSFLNRGSFVSPPQLAFRMIPTYDEMNGNINPFNGGSSNDMDESYEKDHHDGLSTPLLRHLKEEVENHPLQQQHKSERNCQHGSLDNMELSVITSNPQHQHKVCWRDIFIFESCLISVILVFALISEPLVTFHYSGALAHIFEESVDQVLIFTFWDLITAIMRCNDRGIFSVSIAVFVGIHVIILPLLGWICHTIVLLCMVTGRYDCTSKFVTFAKFTHPLHHVAPFAMSIFVASWFMGGVSEFLFDQNMVCNVVQSLVNGDSGSECLRINMKLHPAMFVLVLQAFAMDMFLVLLEK